MTEQTEEDEKTMENRRRIKDWFWNVYPWPLPQSGKSHEETEERHD